MGDLRVRIGPSVDRAAFDAAFASITQSATRAFTKISQSAQKASNDEIRGVETSYRTNARVRKKEETDVEKSHAAIQRGFERAERMKAQAAKRAVQDRMQAEVTYFRGLDRMQRDAERSSARMYREMKRQAKDAAEATKFNKGMFGNPRVGVGLGHGVSMSMGGLFGAGMGAMRFGMGVAGDIAHAYGVNTSMSSAMEKNADLETLATQIANEAHERGNKYADSNQLQEQAFAIGNKTGTGANHILEGFQEFVGKTGDLSTASASMEELAKIAKGTGSSLKDVVGAAADVSNQLGDIPNKAEKVNAVMRVLAGESKLGAVPMRALASQAAKVVASAQMFEGDVARNMGVLGAIAQETRLKGGAASPAQAATAVNSLAGVFRTSARVKAFKEAKINLEGDGGKLRNIEDIIVESLQKTQKKDLTSSNVALNALYGGKLPGKAIGGFESIFRTTFAGASGTEQERLAEATKAVRAEFDRLTRAAMDQKEVDESFARAMQTGQSQAELWNNATQKAAKEMQNALLPAMVALTPKFVALAQGTSDFIDFLTGKKKTPDGTALSADMDAIHKAMANGGKVDQGLVTKALADSQALGAQATTAENEARGMKAHRTGNVLYNAGEQAGKNKSWYDVTGIGTIYDFGKQLTSGNASKTTDTQQADADRKAKDASDQAMRAFKELTSATLKVHIVSSDVSGKEAPGAAEPSTDSLSPNPSK